MDFSHAHFMPAKKETDPGSRRSTATADRIPTQRLLTFYKNAAEKTLFGFPVKNLHTIHMKRTNLMLNEDLLKEAVHLAGVKTYSGVVDMALRDFFQRIKARRILELAGSGLWEGDLADMRQDQPRCKTRLGSR